jgi:hypothetical protein
MKIIYPRNWIDRQSQTIKRYRYVAIGWSVGEMHIIDSISSVWHGDYWTEGFELYIIT